jgi:hypothetical protein
MREAVPDRLVEVLTPHGPDEPAPLRDEDPADAVPLAGDHRLRDGLVGRDGSRGPRHHVARRERLADRARERLQDAFARNRQRPFEHRRRRGRMPAPAQGGGQRARIEVRDAAAGDREHAPVHLDQDCQGAAVGQVDDLVCEVRDAVHVAGPRHGGDEHVDPAGLVGLQRVDQRVEQRALVVGQRRVQERGDRLLPRTVAAAPGERVGVARRGRWVRQRAGVLVDPEREDGRFQRRHGELAFRDHADQRRRQRAVLGDHRRRRVGPVRQLAGVVVEDDLLDPAVEHDRLELAESTSANRLDDDQAADRREVDPADLDHVQLVGVETVEVADVAVQRRGQRDRRVRVQPARGQLRRERVEVRVRVRGDDGLGLHVPA